MSSSNPSPASAKSSRWQDEWMVYADIARAIFMALQAKAADPRYKETGDAWRIFVGSEAVDWMLNKGFVVDRADAVSLGKRLVSDGLIVHVGDMRDFEDDRLPYILLAQTPSEVFDRIGLLRSRARESQYIPLVHSEDTSEIQPVDAVQRSNSANSVLAISEASVEVTENQMLDGDWGDNIKPSDGTSCTPVEAEPGALRLDDALEDSEFEEPDIKHKMLSYMTLDKNGSDPARCGSRGASSAGATTANEAPLDLTALKTSKVFSNLPAFRRKLTTAVASRELGTKISGSQGLAKVSYEPPEGKRNTVFTNLPAFRQKLSTALSGGVSERKRDTVPRYEAEFEMEPRYEAEMEPQHEAEIEPQHESEIEPQHEAEIEPEHEAVAKVSYEPPEGKRNTVFTNLPAFRQKLSTALSGGVSERKRDTVPRYEAEFEMEPRYEAEMEPQHEAEIEPQHESEIEPQHEADIEPEHEAEVEPEYDAQNEWDSDFEIQPIAKEITTVEYISTDPMTTCTVEPMTDSMTTDRARSVGSGWWGPKSGLRTRAWPFFTRTSRLFGRRKFSRSESSMSQ